MPVFTVTVTDQSRQRIERKYANLLNVGHNAEEFILDFGQYHDGDDEAQIHTGIVATPKSALAFLSTLSASVDDYLAEVRATAEERLTRTEEDRNQ